ncbi:AbrB family transcriptional regulator [Devosia sp.]|uniref:AbrB family transcriptional regulator n=1 Tax=Devosia sp. TaxID=1871048 RepID=UPI001AC03F88|nr:AbrB family transcriptional regulator [Devosia sp.]MBN9309830.1 AbrB family transcriptional regulator [Devosia sp.]
MISSIAAGTIARRTIVTLLISAAGGAVAALLGLPAAWLMGGALAVAVAALAGVPVMLPNWLRDTAFVLTGLSMGASVARDSLALMVQWPVTLAALALEMVLIISLTGLLLRKLFGLDRGTAYLSSFPGHLSFVMSIAAAGLGDTRQIIIIQVIRILLLTICVPIGAMFLPIGHFEGSAGPPMESATLVSVAIACGVVGFIFTRLRIPAGYALGAMATSISAKFAGLFEGQIPPLFLVAVFIMIGALIGSRFSGITMAEFRKAAIGGLAGTALTVAIVTVIAFAVLPFVDMPFGQIWLGLSPGALEGMGALGIALGFDTAFIAAHHVGRLLLLTFAIPLVAMLVRQKELP